MGIHIPREPWEHMCSAGERRRILPIFFVSISSQPCPPVSTIGEDLVSVDVHVCAVFLHKEPLFSFFFLQCILYTQWPKAVNHRCEFHSMYYFFCLIPCHPYYQQSINILKVLIGWIGFQKHTWSLETSSMSAICRSEWNPSAEAPQVKKG